MNTIRKANHKKTQKDQKREKESRGSIESGCFSHPAHEDNKLSPNIAGPWWPTKHEPTLPAQHGKRRKQSTRAITCFALSQMRARREVITSAEYFCEPK